MAIKGPTRFWNAFSSGENLDESKEYGHPYIHIFALDDESKATTYCIAIRFQRNIYPHDRNNIPHPANDHVYGGTFDHLNIEQAPDAAAIYTAVEKVRNHLSLRTHNIWTDWATSLRVRKLRHVYWSKAAEHYVEAD
jgi:hypothetical protein